MKDLFIERIGEVEANLSKPQVRMPSNPVSGPYYQAPSTQRLLNEMASEGMPASPAPIIPVPKRIVGGEVNTGNGTKGPRKF